ncbi:superoxide dismutase [Anaerotignum propionicum]|jgi:Fe-Mn family superoxide dismutase|uniref:Superoxide dismutase n=1 Tax=Anaerotignum propionicum DSM 1682 TaxID=991789 RepID=A0A0X1U6T6_ANAPI|nr:superoxide dismutase [Anaerotignum propionicum]AMJ40656.1 superoxide dismutase [Anaerotignum propionicum DSM 1682]MEA5058028.1 superoxide dismutase [Anaerotignum propionicum]SHE90810.1 superoxide dismutase, Fe-Mn family [[Clostridium] propionicum DSM 1682] [Anaerotignum propionicum DSM 1682]
MENDKYPYVNLPLPYAYDALEPFIDAQTMEIHHDKYLQNYINNLNNTIKDYPELQQLTLEELIRNAVYLLDPLRIPIQNNGGGVYNHRIYFNGLQPPTGVRPQGRLIDMIEAQFGSLDNFLIVFKTEALKIFGSGYTWLVFDNGKLRIITMPNQNSPLLLNYCPIIALDVWEHAYFLKHYYMRGAYIDDWMQVINWDVANQNYMECLSNFNKEDVITDVNE